MANLFDAANAPEGEPTEIVVGDFLQWKRSDFSADYPTSSGYTAQYVARIQGDVAEIKIAQSDQSTDEFYLFSISSSDSASFLAGAYRWQLEVTETSSGNRIVLESGDFIVNADMDISESDGRSHAQVMVEKIESLLAGRADSDVSSYAIAGRSLTKLSFTELLEARNYYLSEVAKEKAKDRAKRGLSNGSTIKVRF